MPNMKKLRDKINPVPVTGTVQNPCIGKTFVLGKNSVTVEEVIAEGGFGVVFLAKQGNNKYALKRIVVNNDHDLGVATREIQFMTQLNHPNLLACIDYSVASLGGGITEVLMLMPFLRGSLLSILNNKMGAKTHLSEPEVLDILVDVVGGVSRLHQCSTPVVHRDLKIENVLEEDGKYVLCDFGSATAKFWDPAVHGVLPTQENLEKYTTLAYRSPEMVDLYSNRGSISCKADIWALGVFLYKTCFYTTPFGDSVLAIQSANLTFPSSSPFSPQLHSLIHYLLTPDQNYRPDIFQVAELVHGLHGTPNPIKNVNGVEPSPSIETLVKNMTQGLSAKTKPDDKPIKSTSVTPAPLGPLETSVTPRQRPKGLGSVVVPAPIVGNTLLPPPKSPKPDHVELGHRRNVSDSSSLKIVNQPNEIISATSEQAILISSWNPFDRESSTTTTATASVAAVPSTNNVEEDDPFEKAPFGFDYFKYRPMPGDGCFEDEPGSVDLFGLAPFSNPFLDFTQPHHSHAHQPEVQVQQSIGVTNFSFEDER